MLCRLFFNNFLAINKKLLLKMHFSRRRRWKINLSCMCRVVFRLVLVYDFSTRQWTELYFLTTLGLSRMV